MDSDDIVEEYLSGEVIDSTKHSQFELEKLDEFLGDSEELLICIYNRLREPLRRSEDYIWSASTSSHGFSPCIMV